MVKTKGTQNYYVYILTNKAKSVLYTGFTGDLVKRIRYHREDANLNKKAFCSKYRCFYLIYFERFQAADQAIAREKQIKGWRRSKKEELINSSNPNWNFLNNKIQ